MGFAHARRRERAHNGRVRYDSVSMIDTANAPLAIACRYIRRTIDSSRLDGPVVCLCEHPIRSGFDCIGPFIEDLTTDCGLWEPKSEQQTAVDAPRGW